MSETQKPEPSKTNAGDYKEPGLRHVKTTNVFRVVNFELFAKPNKRTMSIGAVAFLGCLAYIGYLRFTDEYKGQETYTTMEQDGTLSRRVRKSKWD